MHASTYAGVVKKWCVSIYMCTSVYMCVLTTDMLTTLQGVCNIRGHVQVVRYRRMGLCHQFEWSGLLPLYAPYINIRILAFWSVIIWSLGNNDEIIDYLTQHKQSNFIPAHALGINKIIGVEWGISWPFCLDEDAFRMNRRCLVCDYIEHIKEPKIILPGR